MTVTKKAYAKINLFLDIESKRADGFHNILSLMQSVSLFDELTVSYNPGIEKEISVSCDNINISSGKDNLAYKAAALYPIQGKIHISIKKNIPFSAGLGGGSSDAAATLVALNELSETKLSLEELKTIGAKIGADVPFCIEGSAAIASGIGEILNAAPSMPKYPIVIAKMGEGMSTPAAYAALDQTRNNFQNYQTHEALFNKLLDNSNGLAEYCENLYNIFEEVVEVQRPHITKLKNIMKKNGAAGAMMSGSGTSVFGIFEKENDAKIAVNLLKDMGAFAYLCYPI